MSSLNESKDFWVKQLSKLKASGQTRAQYCEANNINYDRFGYSIKKIKSSNTQFVPVKIETESVAPSVASTWNVSDIYLILREARRGFHWDFVGSWSLVPMLSALAS